MATTLRPGTSARTLDAPRPSPVEHVVLLDRRGRPSGTRPKAEAHGATTELHLAFSCHVVGPDGRLLLTRRADSKRTWPGVWTNGCCGHPQLDETLRQAVTRRLHDELGVRPTALAVALPDFTYRAEMDDGTVEHELCPVLVARVDSDIRPAPDEVGSHEWVTWDALVDRVRTAPDTLSPWSVGQVRRLLDLDQPLGAWLDDAPPWAVSQADVVPGRAVRSAVAASGTALDPVVEPLAAVLGGFVAERRAQLEELDPSLGEVCEEIAGLLDAGGKRLRPAFVYWGHRATGADHDPEVLRPAGAVELLHTFALLHDDVMDRSQERRGRPAGHAALADRHRQEDRLGDSDWFGCSAAVLAGDLTFVWADELFESASIAPDVLARARCVFTTLRAEVIAGQYLDLGLAAARQADEAAAHKVALLKSARYTVTRPLLIGAALSPSAGVGVERALRAYGDAVGLAFQMRDDVLGLFGDPAVTGKGVLDDLREGKRTLLVLRALRLATPAQRSVLLAALGDPDLGEEQAARVREVVAESGALASIEALVTANHDAARGALAPLPEPARSALRELADLAIERRG